MSSSKKQKVDHQQPHSSSGDVLTIFVDGKTKSEKGVIQMDDSMHMFDKQDGIGLYTTFADKGYLLLRGFLDPNAVQTTRKSLIDSIQHMGKCDDDGNASKDLLHGYIIDVNSGCIISGQEKYTTDDETQDETKSWKDACQKAQLNAFFLNENISSLFHLLAQGKAATEGGGVKHTPLIFNDHSWLRVKTSKEFTKCHADFFYWKNDTEMFSLPVDSIKNHHCGVCQAKVNPTDVIEQCDECASYFHVKCMSKPMSEKQNPTSSSSSSSNSSSSSSSSNISRSSSSRSSSSRSSSSNSSSSSSISSTSSASSPLLHPYIHSGSAADHRYCATCSVRPVLGTCWFPLGDISVEEGVLAVMPGTASLPNYHRCRNGDEIPTSFYEKQHRTTFMKDKFWHTTNYKAGDVVIFDSQTVHCGTTNTSNRLRLSGDFRWYLAPSRDGQEDNAHRTFVLDNSTEA